VWNDAQKQGRAAVRASVMQSLEDLNFADGETTADTQALYWDLFLIHWPVPGYFVDTYRELELLQQEGHIRAIGLSNFSIDEYERLMQTATIPPVVNQFEVSPFMYRPEDINYFQTKANMAVAASKAMHRGGAVLQENEVLQSIAKSHSVTPGQVMIRWSMQKDLIVLSMSSSLKHQQENFQVTHFALKSEEMEQLDALTSQEAVQARTELEKERKTQL